MKRFTRFLSAAAAFAMAGGGLAACGSDKKDGGPGGMSSASGAGTANASAPVSASASWAASGVLSRGCASDCSCRSPSGAVRAGGISTIVGGVTAGALTSPSTMPCSTGKGWTRRVSPVGAATGSV